MTNPPGTALAVHPETPKPAPLAESVSVAVALAEDREMLEAEQAAARDSGD
jgi:hypothetical protein